MAVYMAGDVDGGRAARQLRWQAVACWRGPHDVDDILFALHYMAKAVLPGNARLYHVGWRRRAVAAAVHANSDGAVWRQSRVAAGVGGGGGNQGGRWPSDSGGGIAAVPATAGCGAYSNRHSLSV